MFLKCKRAWLSAMAFVVMFVVSMEVLADVPLRRPISPERPMLLVHIDTWNYPDPERIIEMVPEDILPYVVFNISLSASDNVCADGYAVAGSWLKACAQKRAWAIVQCASGGHSRFSDHDLSVYEDYFRKYPNFLGWNFAEQFWGFGEEGTPSFLERLSLFGDILKICHRYGGYLVVSFTQAYYSADMMPIAYMKRNPEVNRLLTEHPEHFICCEKYTMQNGFFDIESNCLGAYLGGYAGNYGIRFDDCGWSPSDGNDATENDGDVYPFVKAAGAVPIMEHVMLTGQTVIDGPELIWTDVSREVGTSVTPDGYTRRNWDWFPQYVNIQMDEFRKVLDGTVRILSREEVIDRTKICLQNDINDGTFDSYLTPATLFDGLYRPDCDRDRADGVYNNSWLENKWWMKVSGRYPTIPQVYDLLDDTAKKLQVMKVSEYNTRWPNEAAKVAELNELFPQEYTGDIYAAHAENTWMTYNPYQYEDKITNGVRTRYTSARRASGVIPFLYNTADSISLDFSPYAMAVMKEYPDSVMLYMSNYRLSDDNNLTEAENVEDTVRIYGIVEEPVVTWFDRAAHRASEIKQIWKDGVLTLVVAHNGPVEITVKGKGEATDRQTEWTKARIEVPEIPSVYTGTLQYEAEFFDYKDIGACRTNGYYNGRPGYQGQGYVEMGTSRSASIRDTVTVLRKGTYAITVRYLLPSGSLRLQMNVNGKRQFLNLRSTGDAWAETSVETELNAGTNEVELKFATAAANVLIDCIKIDRGNAYVYDFEDDEAGTSATEPAASMLTLAGGEAGVVTQEGNQALHAYAAGSDGMGQAILDLFPRDAVDYSVSWHQLEGDAGMLLRGGYLFRTQGDKVSVAMMEKDENGILKLGRTLGEGDKADGMAYFRATLHGTKLYFDGSTDGKQWQNMISVEDATFASGETRLCWEASMTVDDIRFYNTGLMVSQTDMEDINMTYGGTNAVIRSLDISGTDLLEDVSLSMAGRAFELSLDSLGEYTDALVIGAERLADVNGTVRVFVRLKPEMAVDDYEDAITIATSYLDVRTVNLKGSVTPGTYSTFYDFEDDAVSSGASNPPAEGITRGTGNLCTAGVSKYTDTESRASKMLRAYSAPSANGTGVLNLDKFTRKSTDYSVMWRQILTSSGDYKNGVILRGDTLTIGNASQGYTPGIMAGYYMNVYNHGTVTDFRIYKSTASKQLNMFNSASVSLQAISGKSIWYRASVSGASKVTLKIEYSTDGENWKLGTSTTDEGGEFLQGATQFVWGLAASTNNFLIDDIAFEGITYDEGVADGILSVDSPATVKYEEYFDVAGRRIRPGDVSKGVIIRRSHLTDGTVKVEKILKK